MKADGGKPGRIESDSELRLDSSELDELGAAMPADDGPELAAGDLPLRPAARAQDQACDNGRCDKHGTGLSHAVGRLNALSGKYALIAGLGA
jgi:hypothetical protein